MWLLCTAWVFVCVCMSCGGCFAFVPAPWRQEETRDCSPTLQAVHSHEGICHSPHTSTTQSSWCANSWNHSYLPRKRKKYLLASINLGKHFAQKFVAIIKHEMEIEAFLPFLFVCFWILTRCFELRPRSFERAKWIQPWICRCAHGC